jgi:hypothetical protein
VQAPATQTPGERVDGVVADAVQENQTQNASVAFGDQNTSDGAVTVQNVTVPDGGYVAVHDSTLLDGDAVGSVVGVSEYLDAGTHENVTVTLYEGVAGADFSNASAPNASETLVAMPHLETSNNTTYDFVASNGSQDGAYVTDGDAVVDAGNVSFDLDRGVVVDSLDAPAYAATNTTVTVNATVENTADENRTEDVAFRLGGGGLDVVAHQNVTVGAGETANVSFDVNTTDVPAGEYAHAVTTYNSSAFGAVTVTDNATVAFDEQATDGSNVSVSDVFVPESGYVAVHDSTLSDGDAVGSVVGVSEYLAAGYHENVSVTLFEGVEGATFDGRELADNETLVAMPHLETSNNTTYDFVASNGSQDGPYVTDGDAVVDAGNVTLVADDGGDDNQTTTTTDTTTSETNTTTADGETNTTTADGGMNTTTADGETDATTASSGTNATTASGEPTAA